MFSRKIVTLVVVLTVLVIGVAFLGHPTQLSQSPIVRPILSLVQANGSDESNVVTPNVVVEVVSPVSVDLSTIPAGVYDPNTQYDRWMRGEIDMENEGILAEEQMESLRRAALNIPASPNIQNALEAGPNAPVLGSNWASIDYNQCCGGGGNVPPDPELAVGPNHVIAVVNVAFAIYNRTGSLLSGPTTFSSFFASSSCGTGVFDPNALYDESTDRYILAIDEGDFSTNSRYCVAVSQTNNPTGAWNLYVFNTKVGTGFMDYPHAGVGRTALYMGGNMFAASGSFVEGRIWAFDKTAMYAGSPATSVTASLGTADDTPQPLNLHGWSQGTWPTSGPHYFMTNRNYNGRDYALISWNDPFGANTVATVGVVNLNTATGVTAAMPVNVKQKGNGGSIQANDFRPLDFEFRNGYGWTTMTIGCKPAGSTTTVDCVRWAQVNLTNATIGPAGAGVYSSNGAYRFFPDLAVNHCDAMVVGYTKSIGGNSGIFPSIFYTGRISSDPAGTLQAEAQLKAGEITYRAFDTQPRRWGDYTEMTIAPDGVTFYYLGEYSKITNNNNGRWGTYIGSFTYACP